MRRSPITTLDGKFRLDAKAFFYEPIDPEDEHYPFPGLVILALAIISWAGVFGFGWCLLQVWRALHG